MCPRSHVIGNSMGAIHTASLLWSEYTPFFETVRKGSSDTNPFPLDDVRADDFSKFLWVFYNPYDFIFPDDALLSN